MRAINISFAVHDEPPTYYPYELARTGMDTSDEKHRSDRYRRVQQTSPGLISAPRTTCGLDVHVRALELTKYFFLELRGIYKIITYLPA